MGGFRDWVIRYNNRFPIDRWWREKHSIPFNSSSHREISPVDMKFEHEEDKLFKEFLDERKAREEREEKFKQEGWLSVGEEELDEEDQEELFNKIDIDQLNEQLNGE